MEVQSISDCLNRVGKMIFEKSLKYLVKGDLEDIRKYIERKQANLVARSDFIENRQAVSSVLSQINHIIEKFYSDDTEEDPDFEYNKLRQRMLKWYDVINTKPEINDQKKLISKKTLLINEWFI